MDDTTLRGAYTKAKSGDKESEEKLFQHLRVRFTVIAKQRLKEDYAEDIAHEACLTVLSKYKGLSSEVIFEPWAYKVLRNKIGSFMRDSKTRNAKLAYSDNIESLVSQNYTGANIELKLNIFSCLKKVAIINPNYIEIIKLKNHGYTTEEICDKLGYTTNNLYVALHRCRTLLYNCIFNNKDK